MKTKQSLSLSFCLLAVSACSNTQEAIVPPFTSTEPAVETGHNEEHKEDHSAQATLKTILEGNKRFAENSATSPHQDAQRKADLIKGQKPHTIVLSCSDSRVPPEIVFDQGLGDLFVVRTAGEVPDTAAVASIEYAVEHLGAHLIVVLGHQSCGAVKATLETPKKKSAGSPNLDTLIGHIRPHLLGVAGATISEKLDPASQAHALSIARTLTDHSTILEEAVEKHGLKIVPAFYSLVSNRVTVLE